MTIQIDLPITAVNRAIVELQAHSAKSLLEATRKEAEFTQRLANPIWSAKSLADSFARQSQQALEVSQRFQAAIRDTQASAKTLADLDARINRPALDFSRHLQRTVAETQAMAKRFDAVAAPILAKQRHLERSFAELVRPIRNRMVAARRVHPLPAANPGSNCALPNAPSVRVVSKAVRIVERALARLQHRRHCDADLRHKV